MLHLLNVTTSSVHNNPYYIFIPQTHAVIVILINVIFDTVYLAIDTIIVMSFTKGSYISQDKTHNGITNISISYMNPKIMGQTHTKRTLYKSHICVF